MSNPINFDTIEEQALEHFGEVIQWLELDGEYKGVEYVCINPNRNDGELGSFKINSETGAWADFATDAKGGGLVSYVAYVKRLAPRPAARDLQKFLATLNTSTTVVTRKSTKLKSCKTQDCEDAVMVVDNTLVIPVTADAPPLWNSYGKFGTPSKSYEYHAADGELLCYVLRFDLEGGKKQFFPLTLHRNVDENLVWKLQALPEPRPLYNLHLLAQQPNTPVLIVEGEKAADAAMQLFPGHVVMTTMNGAQSPGKSDLTPLMGRSVFIWPDADEAGQKYADTLVELLHKQDPSAEISVMQPITVKAGYDTAGNPILLKGFSAPQGWDAADAVHEGWTAGHIQLLGEAAFQQVQVDNSYKVGEFRVSDEGVFHIRYKDEVPIEILICSRIDVIALSRDEQNHNWGLVLKFKDADNVLHQWCMPKEMLSGGSGYKSTLLNLGVSIQPAGKFDQLAGYLLAVNTDQRALSVQQPGWHKNVFVLPNRIIGQTNDLVIMQTSDPIADNIFKQQGTLASWQDNVAKPCEGNSRLVLAISAALTGPALKLLGEENAGFHFVGGSSIGKTTTLEAAASVWGGRDFVGSWRTTDNALESVATKHNDTLLLLDEMSQVNPAQAGEIAYMLGNGKGKGRANKNGGAKQVSTWRMVYLSTGEISLADHMNRLNQQPMAGQEVRFINIPADAGVGLGLFENVHDAGTGQAFSTYIKTITHQHYGHAGPAFIEVLADMASRQEILEYLHTQKMFFESNFVPVDAASQIIRVAKRFALIAAVGELAIACGILPWPEGEAMRGARVCFHAWLDTRGGIENLEGNQAIAQVRRFLELHGESRFTPLETDSGLNDASMYGTSSRTFNRAGFRKATNDGRTEFLVLPEVYNTEICAGLNARDVTKTLRQRGLLHIGNDEKSTVTRNLPGMGSKRVYHLTADILADSAVEGEIITQS